MQGYLAPCDQLTGSYFTLEEISQGSKAPGPFLVGRPSPSGQTALYGPWCVLGSLLPFSVNLKTCIVMQHNHSILMGFYPPSCIDSDKHMQTTYHQGIVDRKNAIL